MTLDSTASQIVAEMAKTVNLTLAERERIKGLIVAKVEPLLAQPWLSFDVEDAHRADKQCQRILELLKSRDSVTNADLSAVALKYTSRLSDLRKRGFLIHCSRLSGGTFQYRLVGAA